MTYDADTECLRNVVRKIIDLLKTDAHVIPAKVATAAMVDLGAADLLKTNPLVYLAAHLHLRQLARHLCRKQFDDDEDDALDPAQQDLFPGLQSRYPAARSDDQEPTYVLRDAMRAEDVGFNARRLRREGKTKLRRADSLEAWWESRKVSEPV